MISSKITLPILGLATAATMLVGAIPAAAQVGGVSVSATASADTSVTTPVATGSVSAAAQAKANTGARLPAVIARGDADIAARIDSLNKLNDRVQGMQNESAGAKASIASQVASNIAGLTTLKAKIDADTDVTVARTDDQSIFTDFRVYALVVPQGWILAASDRVTTISGLMTTLAAKLQTRITAAQTAGHDVSVETAALADMNAKLADAAKQVAAAEARVSVLVPDQGDKTKAAANKTALVASRADIKVATSDLQAARADIAKITSGLKSFNASANASTSASVNQ
jgi:hypothetical protein